MKKSAVYDDSFKEQAVKLSRERNNIMSVARELRVPYGLLYSWRKEADEKKGEDRR
ncbi:transposase [Parabacteroides sp. OttesenSCG-928-N08]|nr:transposase [Parabacteroides sp. OttesenSCG-928-N08]